MSRGWDKAEGERMLTTGRGRRIMSGAWGLYSDAVEMLEQGRIRNAADKAWGATMRATDALILERMGEEPQITAQTSRGIRFLGREGELLRSLHSRYTDRISQLHGDCFCNGHCEPEDYFVELIRDTTDYIRDAESAAGGGN